MTNDVVWSFGFKEVAGFIVERHILDGDSSKIQYVDTTPEKGHNPQFKPGRLYSGRAVKADHVPTRIEWCSKKHPPYDVFILQGLIVVSDTFKDIIEGLEPEVHQFFPIEVVYKDDSPARQMYFFNICNRLDTMDRESTTATFEQIYWKPETGDFAFSKAAIGARHAWRDKHVHHGTFLSDAAKTAMEKARVSGITFHSFPVY
ncbi:imm11 family protein [Roseibium sp.]|uniref:imm11 family protein n=1 Tax=Roseibium sp. TaxID=1936156 RepID=UPI003B52DD2A